MKKTLRQLLEDADRDNVYKDRRIEELRAKLEVFEEKEKKERMNLDRNYQEAVQSNKTLLEIIRWHINPETAKYPFEAEKDQRIVNDRRF